MEAGYGWSMLINKHPFEIIPPDAVEITREEFSAALDRALDAGDKIGRQMLHEKVKTFVGKIPAAARIAEITQS